MVFCLIGVVIWCVLPYEVCAGMCARVCVCVCVRVCVWVWVWVGGVCVCGCVGVGVWGWGACVGVHGWVHAYMGVCGGVHVHECMKV